MPGQLHLTHSHDRAVARVTIDHPGKHNAMNRAMWAQLRQLFEQLQALPPAQAPWAIVIDGANGQFASGGDIEEFMQFRFDAAALRAFHEDEVAPALQAVLNCDIPIYAQIEGACVGGGLEIAACCDIRLAAHGSRFGAPIGKLGFPMAPTELAVLSRVVSGPVLREMLLEARLFDAARALQLGLVHAVVSPETLHAAVLDRVEALRRLSPQAARINKRTLRQLSLGGPSEAQVHAHFSYADQAHHREGVMAFLEKRGPQFERG